MRFNKKFASFALCLTIALSNITIAHADGSSVVTIGADLTSEQKQTVLNYFGVKENEVVVLEVNNLEERKYLQGVASEAQLGTKTFSCAYVQPTKKGNGINVKTANLTYVTSSMIASTLATCGVEDANVIAMTPLSGGVSGTGALTGVMKAFESATGEKLDEEKKEIASEEMVTTSDLGDEIGQDKATGIMNDIKSEVIKNGTQDTTQIAETINNVTNNYNVTLNSDQEKQIQDLMKKISEQNYDYDSLKNTFKNVSNIVDGNLEQLGEKVKHSQGFFEAIGNWFSDLFSSESDKDLGILEKTNDNVLGDNAQINATDSAAVNTTDSKTNNETGFFESICNWFKDLFSSDTNTKNTDNTNSNNNATNTNSTQNNSNTTNTENKTSEGTNSSNENTTSSNTSSNNNENLNSNTASTSSTENK